ncbi:OmpA family protein [Sphingobium chlorophenolicum]|uniref:OmpA/MotB domain protein n=1 Tax=Sphingobium chlorophenolicum TaxID=46429 RepID=A0A081RBV7_SPHCR|nr:OmpA family protein [Sphingobium chlorophenolicum]KEQ52680.1 OmpA/MotB domain protein precursor [Sphingobium chlorophenolicum]
MLAWASRSEPRRHAAVLALLLCMSPAGAAGPVFLPDIAPSSEFPDPGRATRREGVFLPPETPRLLTPGMTKRQVYALLGVPHFREGLIGERQWDYILDFYTGSGTEYRVCRLQLRWDRKMRLEKLAWSDSECRDMVYRPAPVREVAVDPKPMVAASRELALTLYFDFDKAEVREEGRRDLTAFIEANRRQRLSVTGFTDSVGQEAYNDRLSLMRADAVAGILVAMGVPLPDLQVSGAGERSPARRPEHVPDDPLNRRVVVRVMPGG